MSNISVADNGIYIMMAYYKRCRAFHAQARALADSSGSSSEEDGPLHALQNPDNYNDSTSISHFASEIMLEKS